MFSVPHVGPGRQLHLHIQRRALALSGQSGETSRGCREVQKGGGGGAPPPGRDPRNGAIKTRGGETEVEAHRRVDYRHMRITGKEVQEEEEELLHFSLYCTFISG